MKTLSISSLETGLRGEKTLQAKQEQTKLEIYLAAQ